MERTDKSSKKHQNYPLISEETISLSYKQVQSSKHQPNLKLNLKIIDESEENNITTEEESLSYVSNYIGEKKTDLKNFEHFTRKCSNVSTNFSESLPEVNGFSPLRNLNKNENASSYIYFGRDKNNKTPMSDYFNTIEEYFKEKNPEKNEYQNSSNYIKKDIYFRRYFQSSKQIKNLRSFDIAEENKKNVNNIQKASSSNNSTNILCDLRNYLDDIDDKNKKTVSSKQNNIPVNPKMTKINPMNNMNIFKGKFEMPVYYCGYFPVNCKYFF